MAISGFPIVSGNNGGGSGGLNTTQVNQLIAAALANYTSGLPVLLDGWNPIGTQTSYVEPVADVVVGATVDVVSEFSSMAQPNSILTQFGGGPAFVYYVSYEALNWANPTGNDGYSEVRLNIPDLSVEALGYALVGLHSSSLTSQQFIDAAFSNTNVGYRFQTYFTHYSGSFFSGYSNYTQNILVESGFIAYPNVGDDIVIRLYNTGTFAQIINLTTDTVLANINNFALGALDDGLTITICFVSFDDTTTIALEYDISHGLNPFTEISYIPTPVPNGAEDGGGLVPITANGTYAGKELKQGDFCLFYNGTADVVVVSRLVSDSNIRDTISTALNDPNSSLSSLVRDLGGGAGLDSVEAALNEAINYIPSNLTTSLDNFLAYLLNNDQSLFYEALRTYVKDAVYNYIQDDLQNNGTIYNAIAQYVSDSTTGVAGHTIIQSAIEASIDNYASGIGVGNSGGQPYTSVMEAAQAAISNEIQSGGIIDTAIQTAINP